MPRLFQPGTLEEALFNYSFPENMAERQAIVRRWITASSTVESLAEMSLHGDFLHDFFGQVLGYRSPIDSPAEWTLQAERNTAPRGRSAADGAIGHFRGPRGGTITAPIELKSAGTDLERNMPGLGYTPVQQGWWYAIEAGCDWIIISNYQEIRLYSRLKTPAHYETFNLVNLADPALFHEFYFLLCSENLLPKEGYSLTQHLLAKSLIQIDEELTITESLYNEYRRIRSSLYELLRSTNPEASESSLISKTQKILDRILFIHFCETRQLLPALTLVNSFKLNVPGLSRWQVLQGLFHAIDIGDPPQNIPGYNGGLFSPDPILDNLIVTDEACGLLVPIFHYNFTSETSINILGHIFEQSITDLEVMQREAHGEVIDSTSRRKTQGVYYTPPYVTQFIVKETVGRYLDYNWQRILEKYQPDKQRSKKRKKSAWIGAYEEYRDVLRKTCVLDPACGSGAFLIAAFDVLLFEYERVNRAVAEIEGSALQPSFIDLNTKILNNNLFGVDLNEESVEITKLSLWIKTAEKGKPLTDLDHNIQCGNSLVDDSQVDQRAFNWQEHFSDVFQDGGFCVVIGNPPYIKLQNFKRYHEREAQWLSEHYESCTGNWDIYLPFIEKGISLLKPEGRMGFIAPSLWRLSNYGEGLIHLLAHNRHLEKFIDLKDFQVFRDAITYTALQFFTNMTLDAVEYYPAPTGDLVNIEWNSNSYDELGNDVPWKFTTRRERELLRRLSQENRTLGDIAEHIFQGLITSADRIYCLQRVQPGQYYSRADNSRVRLEDSIMRLIVRGDDAKRYQIPDVSSCILFPYDVHVDEIGHTKVSLLTQDELQNYFPNAWAYLKSHEEELRQRESGNFDIDEWWKFGRSQNLDKQHRPKLGVAETVPSLRLFFDPEGSFCLHNVRVNGITVQNDDINLLWFLLGVLNAPVANFIFKRIAKPKVGGYFEANRQFIEPLPIPNASPDQKNEIAALAEHLCRLHTDRERIIVGVLHRICTDLGNSRSPSRKLEQWHELEFADLHKEIRAIFRHTIPVAERGQWETFITSQKEQLSRIEEQISSLEIKMNSNIFSLYRLSDMEIRMVLNDLFPVANPGT